MKDLYSEIVNKLKKMQDDTESFIIGESYLGENMIGYHIGSKEGKQILLTGGIHAREYLSTLYLIEEMEYLKNKDSGVGYYILPLLNPDGVKIAISGIDFLTNYKFRQFLVTVNDGLDFSLWKANARAVDLNVNFDADWGKGSQNVFVPKSENYVGIRPNSEMETQSIVKFVTETRIDASLAFHTKGEVIYYGFKQVGEALKKDAIFARELAKVNGYITEQTQNSAGGLTDYLRYRKNIPSFTIELGRDYLVHPLKEEHLEDVFRKNKQVPIRLSELLIFET